MPKTTPLDWMLRHQYMCGQVTAVNLLAFLFIPSDNVFYTTKDMRFLISYAILVGWGLVLTLEKLQERALRFVFCDATASYEDLLERGIFLPLSVYRIRCLGIEVSKCFHGLNPAYLNDIFIQPSLKYSLRDSCRLEQPKFRTFTYGLRSFRYYGSKLCNLLPYQVKNTRDIVTFKINITEWCHSKQCISHEIF